MLNIFIISLGLTLILLLWWLVDPRALNKRFNIKIVSTYLVLYVVFISQIIGYYYFQLPYGIWDLLLRPVGILLIATGTFLDVWARITMNKYWGPPGQHDLTYQKKLIITGPFAFSRNPIYMGTFFLILGLSLILRSRFFFMSLFLLWYFILQITIEEKLLLKIFGKKYEEYKNKVPRFIRIPN